MRAAVTFFATIQGLVMCAKDMVVGHDDMGQKRHMGEQKYDIVIVMAIGTVDRGGAECDDGPVYRQTLVKRDGLVRGLVQMREFR